jgi:MFS family permease
VAAAFICLFVLSGCGFYSLSLFVRPLQDEFNWSRAEVMLGNTIMTLVQGAASVLVGRFIDRYGPKRVIIAGAFIGGLSLVILSTMNRLWQYYVLFGVAGAGFAALGFIPATALIVNWFRKKRGTAIGIIGIGVGAGGFVISTITGNFLLPGFGWRFSWIILGLFTILAVVPFTLLVVKTRPEDIGLQPDGINALPAEAAAARAASKEGLDLKQALKTQALVNFNLLYAFRISPYGHYSEPGSSSDRRRAHLSDCLIGGRCGNHRKRHR